MLSHQFGWKSILDNDMNAVLLAHPHTELTLLAIVMLFSFHVKWEILQVDVMRAMEKRDNSGFHLGIQLHQRKSGM